MYFTLQTNYVVKTTALSAQSGTGFSNNPEHVEPKFLGVGRDAEALSVIAIQIYQRMPQFGNPMGRKLDDVLGGIAEKNPELVGQKYQGFFHRIHKRV